MQDFTEFFSQVDPAELAAWVSQLPERDQIRIAMRAGLEIGDERRDRRRTLREWSWDMSEHLRKHPVGPSYAEMQRRRGLAWSERLGRWAATPLSEVE